MRELSITSNICVMKEKELGLTQATSNRVFRAADGSTTPIATLTPAANNAPTELSFESGGPGNLDNYQK